MLGSGRSNCNVTVKKNKIIKIYEDFAEKRYLNELNIYLYAKKKKLSYIPKLLNYDKDKHKLVIENVGKPLTQYRKDLDYFLPKIKKAYNNLIKNRIYHNDLRLKNILYNEKKDKIYLIDFENSGPKYKDTDHENLVKKINNISDKSKKPKMSQKKKKSKKIKKKSKRK
tara:strand:+ start:758 stop:1264 length:507 start_codon:yes stop_codon:yes gene_type:complete